MQRNTLLLAIASAVIGTLLLRAYMSRFEQEASGGPRSAILVLTADLTTGESITREAVSARDVPAAYRESRHIPANALDQVIGARLAVPGRANESLLWTDLAHMRARTRQLSGIVPEGMRAMTLESTGREAGLLLTPGDRVDVLGTAGPAATAQDPIPRMRTVAEDLLVLGVGSDLGGPSVRSKARQGAVTLSVTPEQSRLLGAAEQVGALRLVVRNPDDLAFTEKPGTASNPATGKP